MNKLEALTDALQAVNRGDNNNCTLAIETKEGPVVFSLGHTGICHGPTGRETLTALLQALIEDDCVTLDQLKARAIQVLKQSRGEATDVDRAGDPRSPFSHPAGPSRLEAMRQGPQPPPQPQ